jgi:hypothetical protein
MGEELFGPPSRTQMLAAKFLAAGAGLLLLGWWQRSHPFWGNTCIEFAGFALGAFVALLVLDRHQRRERELRWDPVCQELLRGAARDIVTASQQLHRHFRFRAHWHAGMDWAEADMMSPRVADNIARRSADILRLVDESDVEKDGYDPHTRAGQAVEIVNGQFFERLQRWVQPLLTAAEGDQTISAVRALQGLASSVSSGWGHLGAHRAQETSPVAGRAVLGDVLARMEDTYRKIIAAPVVGPWRYDMPENYPDFSQRWEPPY